MRTTTRACPVLIAVVVALAPTQTSAQPDADAALARKDWAAAIDLYGRAHAAAPRAPQVLIGLARAHVGAGHELAAIAWLGSYAAVVSPTSVDGVRALNDVLSLQIVAEMRIRRLVQEGSDALQEIGAADPPAAAAVQRLTVVGLLAAGQVLAARKAVEAATDSPAEQDRMWKDVALEAAEDHDFGQAIEATANMADPTEQRALVQSWQAQQAEAARTPMPERWLELAHRLLARQEVVNLDAMLSDIGRAPPADVPIRLLRIASTLRAAYGEIQKLTRAFQTTAIAVATPELPPAARSATTPEPAAQPAAPPPGANPSGGLPERSLADVVRELQKTDQNLRERWETSCGTGNAQACYLAGGAQTNRQDALAFYKKACDLGAQDGCTAYKRLGP